MLKPPTENHKWLKCQDRNDDTEALKLQHAERLSYRTCSYIILLNEPSPETPSQIIQARASGQSELALRDSICSLMLDEFVRGFTYKARSLPRLPPSPRQFVRVRYPGGKVNPSARQSIVRTLTDQTKFGRRHQSRSHKDEHETDKPSGHERGSTRTAKARVSDHANTRERKRRGGGGGFTVAYLEHRGGGRLVAGGGWRRARRGFRVGGGRRRRWEGEEEGRWKEKRDLDWGRRTRLGKPCITLGRYLSLRRAEARGAGWSAGPMFSPQRDGSLARQEKR
jgi:hypothetical protein